MTQIAETAASVTAVAACSWATDHSPRSHSSPTCVCAGARTSSTISSREAPDSSSSRTTSVAPAGSQRTSASKYLSSSGG